MKLVKVLEAGEEVIIDFLAPFSIMEVGSKGEKSNHAYSAVTVTAFTEVAHLKAGDLSSMIRSYPTLGLALSQHLWSRLLRTYEFLASKKLSVQERLLFCLGRIAPEKFRFTHRELAQFIQTTPETMSRKLRELQEEGVIRVEKEEIRVLKEDALKGYLFNDHG